MLGSDGSSLNDEASAAFMTFLASQISDLIAYFASRNLRSTGMVDLTGVNENSNEQPLGAQLKTPTVMLRLDMSSGSDSHMFEPWAFPETYSTPVMDPPARPPVSGVRFFFENLFISLNVHEHRKIIYCKCQTDKSLKDFGVFGESYY